MGVVVVRSPCESWSLAGDGHHAPTGAAFLGFVRSMLVREVDRDLAAGGPALALCGLLPPEWRGQGIEVHDAPTDHGHLSYAVRWHGERPALLWELEPHQGCDPVVLVAPGLDPDWSCSEPRGEALLGAVTHGAGDRRPDQRASFS